MSDGCDRPEIAEALGGHPPTDEQWRAISMPLEPYVLVAGAGSGKTSVMAARVVYLALVAAELIDAGDNEGVLPGNVMCLTFTNKATENLMLRVRRALSHVDLAEGDEPEIENYHSFAARILQTHGLYADIEPGQRVLAPAQRTELVSALLDEVTFDHVKSTWQPSLVTNILALADQMADQGLSPDTVVAHNRGTLETLAGFEESAPYIAAAQRIELAQAVDAFHLRKRELGVIDFGDQIQLALGIVEQRPEIGEDLRSRFKTALLDEYQDTNVAQAKLIRCVFGDGFPVTAVGDPDQNIYAWRGASLYNLLEFPERFKRADGTNAERLPLYTNFRSGAHILEAADTIIAPIPTGQRPDEDKHLVPWEANGDGGVEVRRFDDEWTEAQWIADTILDLHGDPGTATWADFAVLCRSSRLFSSLQRAFEDREVEAEFVDLAGLLRMPEVVEILSYAQAVTDPRDAVSLGRILLGPRYRVGYKDLACIAAWARGRNTELRTDTDDEDPANRFLFIEGLEHLDQVTDLSEEGRARIGELMAELRGLRAIASRQVSEFLAEVSRRIGLPAELDADLNRIAALGRRRNIAAFLEQVAAFTPLDGDANLGSLLRYVKTVERGDKEEWAPVQPSDDDSVKVMTIHKAKGLEFDTVFVPGFADGIMPNATIQQNPAKRGYSLDFELREDGGMLPKLQAPAAGAPDYMKKLRKALADLQERLKANEIVEERRTCYVALTRAKRRLFATGAWWYGDNNQNAKKESEFLNELTAWGSDSKHARVDTGAAETANENPLMGFREGSVRDWPGPALREGEADDVFPKGWRRAALEASVAGGTQGSLLDPLGEDERASFERIAQENRTLASHLLERENAEAGESPLPNGVSVSNLITYGRCPKRFYWSAVRPLPQFGGPAARLGNLLHQWIEQQAAGQTSLLELAEEPDLLAEEMAAEPGKLEQMRANFLASRFGKQTPLFVERPFILNMNGFAVRGRIDGIFGRIDGPWEVVDYKSGKVAPPDDPLTWLQLDLYALACVDVWGKDPADLTLTYFYVGVPAAVERPAGDIADVRARVETSLGGIAGREFDPTPSDHCRHCDFRSFCDAGLQYLAAGN